MTGLFQQGARALFVLFLFAAGGLFLRLHYVEQAQHQLQTENRLLTEQRDQAQFLLARQQETQRYFETLNQVTNDKQQQSQTRSEQTQIQFKTVLVHEPCSRVSAPGDIVERLRQHADQIRSAGLPAVARQSADTLRRSKHSENANLRRESPAE